MDTITQQYEQWCLRATADPDLISELISMKGDQKAITDAFYQNLAFGTGGLRGIIGAGTNRMNLYTVAKASQGLADYIRAAAGRQMDGHKVVAPAASAAESRKGTAGRKKVDSGTPRVAVSYDSRIKSDLFARTACSVLAANGLEVFLYPRLMPTPCLSFAVRELGCMAGIMITASHNPALYNGYKVYGPDGCQITTEAAKAILKEIEKLDLFEDCKTIPFEDGVSTGSIRYIPEEVLTAYVEAVKSQSLRPSGPLSVIYTPLNGTGLEPVIRALRESGYEDVTVVEEQRDPDGHFPTCPYPNPEVAEAMELGIRCAAEREADLVLATDPDCDRAGIAVRDDRGIYRLLSGNQTGLLLLNYICASRAADCTMPRDPIFMKTIVTTGMAEKIASRYGVRTVNLLTGFKFIGEQLGILEKDRRADSFLFAFEESYGYLSGSYVRDKDGVVASLLICEMAAFYKAQGLSLWEKLEELYRTCGYCLDTQHCYHFEGADGAGQMTLIMEKLRGEITHLGGKRIVKLLDYRDGLDGLPPSNVVRFLLEGDCSVVVRPSGTEPKLKVYISVCEDSRETAAQAEREIAEGIAAWVR